MATRSSKSAGSTVAAASGSSGNSTPRDGWVQELRLAESAAKKDPNSVSARLRVARDACKLRQWKKCKKSAELGLSLNPSSSEMQQLKICLGLAEKELSQKSFVDEPEYRDDTLPDLLSGDLNPDTLHIYTGGPCYTNLNILQFAALRGDVRLLEDVVALGAALDHPVLDKNVKDVPSFAAPEGSTALVLICTNLAMYYGTSAFPSSMISPEIHEQLDGALECAIRLVKLGADVLKTLQVPIRKREAKEKRQQSDKGKAMDEYYREVGLNGKTAKELAIRSGKRSLIDAIAQMESKEDAIALAQCRCGSRLPWKQCHSGLHKGESPHYIEGKDMKLKWRYSPHAPCPCKHTNKMHFKCCWYTTKPSYQDDATGGLRKLQKMSALGPGGQASIAAMLRLRQAHTAEGGDDSGLMFPARDEEGRSLNRQMTNEEIRKLQAAGVRAMGQDGLRMMAAEQGPKCRFGEWDPEVVAGCMERIDDAFTWNDLHWGLDESELLQRTKEWNDALEQYCNDMDLTGHEREVVIKKHTASPLAPCANPSCNVFETKVKGFKRCGRCKTVGYCSTNCQKQHWKAHKATCFEN